MANYFEIDGYWKDDKSEFCGYIVKDTDDVIEEEDDSIFFYGITESSIKAAIEAGENGDHEFVITDYRKTEM